MEGSDVAELLDDAQELFERGSGDPEKGLEVDSSEMLQLRKACRLIDAANQLIERGYYTLIVEASFAAIERTIQFYLITLVKTTDKRVGSRMALPWRPTDRIEPRAVRGHRSPRARGRTDTRLDSATSRRSGGRCAARYDSCRAHRHRRIRGGVGTRRPSLRIPDRAGGSSRHRPTTRHVGRP